jgi:hypothetical protein
MGCSVNEVESLKETEQWTRKTDSVSETLYFLVTSNSERREKSRKPKTVCARICSHILFLNKFSHLGVKFWIHFRAIMFSALYVWNYLRVIYRIYQKDELRTAQWKNMKWVPRMGGPRLSLTTSLPSLGRFSGKWGSLDNWQPWGSIRMLSLCIMHSV